jgi:hypothetical protein
LNVTRINKNQTEYYQYVKQEYINKGNPWPASLSTIIDWADTNHLLETPKRWKNAYHLDKMRRALREEYHTDPKGRRVRTNHPFREPATNAGGEKIQQTIWGDIWTITPDQMRRSAQTRRRQSLGEVKQIKTDIDSFNDYNQYGANIQMSFNFDRDLAELSQDTDYNPDQGDEGGAPIVPK